MASAGHPAPYCEGRELEVLAGLPLGVMAEAEWQETRITLSQGSQVTLVSDRTRDISAKPAQTIAETALAWGQNDDITVVTVRRSA